MKKLIIPLIVLIIAIATFTIALQICKLFSSPSSERGVPGQGASRLFYSIEIMQEWSGATVDGKWGPETDRKYKAALAKQDANQYAVELYEETP